MLSLPSMALSEISYWHILLRQLILINSLLPINPPRTYFQTPTSHNNPYHVSILHYIAAVCLLLHCLVQLL